MLSWIPLYKPSGVECHTSMTAPASNSPVSERTVPRMISGLWRSEEHTSELQSLMRISYAVFCLKKKKQKNQRNIETDTHTLQNTTVQHLSQTTSTQDQEH